MDNRKDEFEKFKDLISKIRVATLITHSNTDGLKGRPMGTSELDHEGDLWFFTNEFTEKVEEISLNNDVLLSYADPSNNTYVVVNGKAALVKDKQKMESLWNPALKAWFPEGLDDPRLMLLKVEPDEAEYWSGSSSKIVLAFQMLKAMIKGEEFSDGDHKKLTVN